MANKSSVGGAAGCAFTVPPVLSFSSRIEIRKDLLNRLTFPPCFIQSDLDLLESIKLVNYIRSEVRAGNTKPDISSKAIFEDDIYMRPVLEDDALLYSLEDLGETEAEGDAPVSNATANAKKRVLELQEQLERLQGQFSEYRLAVQKSLDDQLSKEDDSSAAKGPTRKATDRLQEADADYFTSYSYNGTLPRWDHGWCVCFG